MKAQGIAARAHALALLGLCGPVPPLGAQGAQPMPPPPRPEQPLNCRGGGALVFDTIDPASGGGVQLSLTFAANAAAAGPEGQGLEPGTCAWVSRPLLDRESRRIRFTIGPGDTTPRRTVRDSDVYWGFLAYHSDSGYIRGVGYRHWHASSPPRPHTRPAPVAVSAPAMASRRSLPLPFDLRYLPLFAVGMGVIIGIPSVALLGRWSGWRRLAERYPQRNAGRGPSLRSGPIVMNRSVYRAGVRFTIDDSHLHCTMPMLARPGHAPFSVPWSEVETSRDEWPWFPFKGVPMVRLTVAAYPDLRILVKLRDAERIAEASGGRLEIRSVNVAAEGGRRC